MRKTGKLGKERRARGREFQTVDEANEKERRPFANRISGKFSKCLSADLRLRAGLWGVIKLNR